MIKDFQQRLRSIKTTERLIKPDAAWRRATRETLVMQIGNTLPLGKASWSERSRAYVRLLASSRIGELARRPVMAVLSIFVVLMGGSMLSVSAAERAMPGDIFYGLKLVSEQAQLAMAGTKEDQLKMKTRFTGRRVNELQEVAKDDSKKAQVAQVAEILKRDLNTMKQQLTDVTKDVSPENAVAAAKMVDQKTNEVINALQETKTNLSPESVEKVTEVQSVAADTGVKAIEVMAEKHKESNDSITESDVQQAIQDHTKVVTDMLASSLSQGDTSSTTSTERRGDSPDGVTTRVTPTTTTSTLPELVSQMKDMTTQAFTLQKAQDQLDVAAAASLETGEITGTGSPTDATTTIATTTTQTGRGDASAPTTATTTTTIDTSQPK